VTTDLTRRVDEFEDEKASANRAFLAFQNRPSNVLKGG